MIVVVRPQSRGLFTFSRKFCTGAGVVTPKGLDQITPCGIDRTPALDVYA